MFKSHVRRSGSLRSIWHRRERKRRPADPTSTTGLVAQPRPISFTRPAPAEADWQSGDPRTMIGCVARLATDREIVAVLSARVVARKLQLFYCACCRLRWDVLPVLGRHAVEVIERYADGLVNSRRLRAARRTAQAVERSVRPAPHVGGSTPGDPEAAGTVRLAIAATEVHTRLEFGGVPDGAPVGAADQVVLLRELFGNPFRPVEIAATWLTPTVIALARAIHAERAFELMPVLGDALQDAGCDHTEVLAHCYGPGSHAAGCWLVDRLSGWEGA